MRPGGGRRGWKREREVEETEREEKMVVSQLQATLGSGTYPALGLERRIKQPSLNGECIGLDPDSREMFRPGTAVCCP